MFIFILFLQRNKAVPYVKGDSFTISIYGKKATACFIRYEE